MNTEATPGALGSNDQLGPLLDTEEDPARLWAEIHRLRAAVKGPDGYATWQEAATAERVRRARLQAAGESLVHAYRAKYKREARDDLRANAPLQAEFGALNHALRA